MTTTPAPLVSVRDLHVEYREPGRPSVHAVRGISFDIPRGEVLGLVGESGSGKSSAARAIARLEESRGEILVDGVDLAAVDGEELRRLRPKFQMVFQDSLAAMDPRASVAQTLARPLVVQGIGTAASRRERARELLELVGLGDEFLDRPPASLSGGQRQRVNIARALALESPFLICDEPVSALDVSIQAQILTLLSDLKRRLGLTILFISHDLAVVRHFCDKVAVMFRGELVEFGDVEDVLFRPQHDYTRRLLRAAIDVVELPGE